MKTLFTLLVMLLLSAGLVSAQQKPKPAAKPLAAPKVAPRATATCVQADLTHPDQTTATWTAGGTGQTGYIIQRKLGAGGTYAQIATPGATATSYVDTTIVRDPVNMNEYYYRISATYPSGSSAFAPEQCIDFAARPPPPVLNPPAGFTLSALSTEEVQASWAGDNTNTVTGYSLSMVSYTPPNSYGPFVTQPPTTSYVVGGLQKNKTYCGTMFQSVGTTNSPSTPQSCATTRAK
jgi:hypothetical protein